MKSILLLFFSLLLLASSCHKKQEPFTPSLPPITTAGLNTFGCYIDGHLLTPRDKIDWEYSRAGMEFLEMYCFERRFAEIIVIDGKSAKRGSLNLHIEDFFNLSKGIFPISLSNCEDECESNTTINVRCFLYNDTSSGEEFNLNSYCSSDSSGELTINRYDTINKIVSGTFYFRAINKDDITDTIEITQGRFDINWSTLTQTDFP